MFGFKEIRRQTAGSAIEKFAMSAGVAALCAVIAAEGFAALARRGELPKVTLVWPDSEERRLAKAAPSASAPPGETVTIYRNIDIDGVITSTIPRINVKSANPIEPCGDEQK